MRGPRTSSQFTQRQAGAQLGIAKDVSNALFGDVIK
jgi:hypothetical protein